jgi:hypothetical protein
MVFKEFIEYTFQFLVEAVLHISFIFCWGMNVQNNDIKSAPYSCYLCHPSINSTLSTADIILLWTKKNYLIHDSHSP